MLPKRIAPHLSTCCMLFTLSWGKNVSCSNISTFFALTPAVSTLAGEQNIAQWWTKRRERCNSRYHVALKHLQSRAFAKVIMNTQVVTRCSGKKWEETEVCFNGQIKVLAMLSEWHNFANSENEQKECTSRTGKRVEIINYTWNEWIGTLMNEKLPACILFFLPLCNRICIHQITRMIIWFVK